MTPDELRDAAQEIADDAEPYFGDGEWCPVSLVETNLVDRLREALRREEPIEKAEENDQLREALRLALAALEIAERGDTPNVAAIAAGVARKAAEGLLK